MLNHKFNSRRLIWILGLLSFSVLVFGCQKGEDPGPEAPDFSLQDLSGKTVTLKQYRGSVVVVEFWATWCPPCRAAMPDLIKMQDKYKEKGLVILGISTDDTHKVSNEYLRSFCEKFKTNYLILRYDYKVIEDYFGLQAPALPTTYVIDREGHVSDKIEGYDHENLEKAIERLLE